jgi:hypothetical protein
VSDCQCPLPQGADWHSPLFVAVGRRSQPQEGCIFVGFVGPLDKRHRARPLRWRCGNPARAQASCPKTSRWELAFRMRRLETLGAVLEAAADAAELATLACSSRGATRSTRYVEPAVLAQSLSR